MPEPFLSSDEYGERANQLYSDGQYDQAVEALREGLGMYPHAAELHVAMGYARLAREEYAWARKSFDEALAIEPDHGDALAGLGEVLLKLGEHEHAIARFERVAVCGFHDDLELMLQIGRALFRDNLFTHARQFFERTAGEHPDSAEAAACVGYAAHRLHDDHGALEWLHRALELDGGHSEARIHLANLLYDRGEYDAALAHLEQTDPEDHADELALWRLIELKKSVYHLRNADPELRPQFERLAELRHHPDSTDRLLAEIEARAPDGTVRDPRQLNLFGAHQAELPGMSKRPGHAEIHRVALPNGSVYMGTWEEIALQMKKDDRELYSCSVEDYMIELARRCERQTGIPIPATDPETFIRASARAGLLRIDS